MGCVRPEMVVAVGVGDRVRVDVAAVEMRVSVRMRMRVVPHERIDDDERRPRDHYGERREVDPRQAFLQQQEREKRPDERRGGVVRARLRRAKRILGADIADRRRKDKSEPYENLKLSVPSNERSALASVMSFANPSSR